MRKQSQLGFENVVIQGSLDKRRAAKGGVKLTLGRLSNKQHVRGFQVYFTQPTFPWQQPVQDCNRKPLVTIGVDWFSPRLIKY